MPFRPIRNRIYGSQFHGTKKGLNHFNVSLQELQWFFWVPSTFRHRKLSFAFFMLCTFVWDETSFLGSYVSSSSTKQQRGTEKEGKGSWSNTICNVIIIARSLLTYGIRSCNDDVVLQGIRKLAKQFLSSRPPSTTSIPSISSGWIVFCCNTIHLLLVGTFENTESSQHHHP